jgi:hypothetical protein
MAQPAPGDSDRTLDTGGSAAGNGRKTSAEYLVLTTDEFTELTWIDAR